MTVGKQKKYLRDSPVPTQTEIRERMGKRFGQASHLVQDIIHPCAEETERIIIEMILPALAPNAKQRRVVINYLKNTWRVKLTGYHCPSCQYHQIRTDHKFCPGCGKPIQWRR